MTLSDLVIRWTDVKASERANYQLYLSELCQALGVEGPRPAGSGYEFEFPVRVVNRDGRESTNFIDLYKSGHFALEAKDEEPGRSSDLLLRRAFGQVRSYIGHLPHERPPYLMVMDVARTLLVWDHWNGDYGGFAAARVIDLTRIPENSADAALLRDIWTNPGTRDPRGKAVEVTKEIAFQLADLAAALEQDGYERERVARFLMRCVFTMFAEDVGLLPGEPFRHLLEEVAVAEPAEFVPLAEQLWRAMDRGERFLLKRLLRFNGHFFAEAEAIPLSRRALSFLLTASRADWKHVEPSIFGTLLTRALDPQERHRTGAEYTPREYVERLVRPTVYEPLQSEWAAVQAVVVEITESAASLEAEARGGHGVTTEEQLEIERNRTPRERERAARKAQRLIIQAVQNREVAAQQLLTFHERLRNLTFLDPACGSGNFLYVTLHLVKRIELEVLRELALIRGTHEIRLEEVGPQQFHGIEISPWAREIAELTLWIGYHQFWREHHDVQPSEPILRDTGTLEVGDAVLAWDAIEEDPARSRPDPMPRLRHLVTGALVPDPDARLPYEVRVNPRPAEWPRADFIIGNPPYMGRGRQRDAFGDGYVDALRASYPSVPDNADYVMYWWHRAAEEVAAGRTVRAGLITTNTITQRHNREVIEHAVGQGVKVVWAAPDHPWVEGGDGAAVRVAMTVIAREAPTAARIEVDDSGVITREVRVPRLNADLSTTADVPRAAAVPLTANRGLSSQGFTLVGEGFRLTPEEGTALLAADPRHAGIVKQIVSGRDITSRPRGIHTIDFGLRDEVEAREFPVLYDLVRDRVMPGRAANGDRSTRERWWRFGRNRDDLRAALAGLPRYIATSETARHRVFQFLPAHTAAEHSVVCIASSDSFHLGVLSSSIHIVWALAAGGRLGVGNDARYQKALTFDPFPFPDPTPENRARVADLAERIDRHRQAALARDTRVTITGMYNVLEKLRGGVQLTPSERGIHELVACGTLLDLHNDLDQAVADAYSWPWPLPAEETLARLVALHDARVEEERLGEVRWLRPGYQQRRFSGDAGAVAKVEVVSPVAGSPDAELRQWPPKATEQIAALQGLIAMTPMTVDDAMAYFRGCSREIAERHLDTLVLLGEANLREGRYFKQGEPST